MCAQTHGCAYVQPHAPTRPYVYTPMYAHVRTYTHTRMSFSDNKSALQHYQTEFHHQSDTIYFYYPLTVQSVSILEPHWLRNLYKLLSFITHFPLIYHSLAIIFQPFINYLSSPKLCPIYYHWRPSSRTVHPHIIFHLYLIYSPTNSPSYQYVSLL